MTWEWGSDMDGQMTAYLDQLIAIGQYVKHESSAPTMYHNIVNSTNTSLEDKVAKVRKFAEKVTHNEDDKALTRISKRLYKATIWAPHSPENNFTVVMVDQNLMTRIADTFNELALELDNCYE